MKAALKVLDVPALVRANTAQIEVDILRELELGARPSGWD